MVTTMRSASAYTGSVLLIGWGLAAIACTGANRGVDATGVVAAADVGDHRDGPRVGTDASPSASAGKLAPQIVGDFWQVASSPDLGAYDNRPDQQVVDFAIWQAVDGSWQLWSCIRFTKVGGYTRLFYRWEGQNLTDSSWEPKGIAMMADPALGETPGGLQAPYVIRVGDTWHMFYGDWAHIGHAISTDGKAFTRVIQPDGKTGLFSEGPNTRDPMMFVAPGQYRLYYTTSAGVDFVRTSTDLRAFGPSKIVARGGSAGVDCCSAECPFVAQPVAGGDYFLFRTQRYGADAQTSVYRSPDPFDFGIDDDSRLVGRLPIAAPELIQANGRWYLAALRGDLQGIQIARLEWRTP